MLIKEGEEMKDTDWEDNYYRLEKE